MKSVANSGSDLLEVPTFFCKACARGYTSKIALYMAQYL